MQVDKAPMGRTLRNKKEKVAKHLKRSLVIQHLNSIPFTRHDPHVYYDPILVIKPQTSSGRIDDDLGLIPACHCGAEYGTEYSASIKIHTPTSIDSANQKSIDNHLEESIDSSPDDAIEDFPEGPIDNWENDYYNPTFAVDTATLSDRANLHTEEYDEDYKEERTTEYRGFRAEEDRLLNHSYGIRNATSIDGTITTSIDTHYYQTNRPRASTDMAYYTSFDTGVDHTQEGN
ncbi:hypothetical protein DY000_02048178 [Brassica cretica]|uniref:Uncharacterized protein n=1 Tax=Brassica cretica TaxID=69181 RepID=A0ABQ7EQI7_BRACR|nr:hypothetical protein DY000_02048178 [Brassica cretica]